MFQRQKRNYKIMISLANRTSLAIFVVTIAFWFLSTSNAQAAVLLLDEGTGLRNNVGYAYHGGTVGVRFTVGSLPILVTSLGLWDGPNDNGGYEGDGLEVGTEVGLWDISGSLLASVSIAQGTVGSLVDGSTAYSVFASITPVTLDANTQYRIGALYTSGGNAFQNDGIFDTSAVNVWQGVYNWDGENLNWPGYQDAYNYFASATMQFTVIPFCEGDFDGDGDVDGSDLAVFAPDFGRTDCP